MTVDRYSRNHFHGPREYAGYYPLNAQDRASERRRRQRKLCRNLELRDSIIAGLERCWSPEQIAGRLRHEAGDGGTVCHETIYRYVYGPEGREAGLHRHLPKARRRRQQRYGRKPRSSPIPANRAIQHRPPEVEDRQTFGHWEADLLIFRREHGKANLTSVIERQTRYTILLPNPDRQSNALIGRIGQAWQGLPEGSCRTITFDRGTEFAAYAILARASRTEAYFCDPHSPWQKGAVENTNGRIRRFLPGDRNLAELAKDELQRVTAMLNATPRRCLGYRTPHEAFHDQLATLPRAA
jgi:IS30 family transposase